MRLQEEMTNRTIQNFNLVTSLLTIVNSNKTDDISYTLAKYLLVHFNEIEHLNIYDFANACFTSRSSIQRFVKSIGYDSFTTMKQKVAESRHHLNAYHEYARQNNFESYFNLSIQDMVKDITEMYHVQNMDELIDQILKCEHVVILLADTCSSSARDFQREMILLGKIIHVVTSSCPETNLLNRLTENDLIITISTTGSFAIAIHNELSEIKAHRVLLTINHSKQFESWFNKIYYLSSKEYASDEILANGLQNVYTKYGPHYFFDLLFSHCLKKHEKTV